MECNRTIFFKVRRRTDIIIVPSYDYDKIELDLIENFSFSPKIISIEQFLAKGKIIDPYF